MRDGFLIHGFTMSSYSPHLLLSFAVQDSPLTLLLTSIESIDSNFEGGVREKCIDVGGTTKLQNFV